MRERQRGKDKEGKKERKRTQNQNNSFIGPNLPDTIYGSAMVQHPNGGAVLLIRSKIYQLSYASSSQWKLMPQTVLVPRDWITAFFIPDEIVTCINNGK